MTSFACWITLAAAGGVLCSTNLAAAQGDHARVTAQHAQTIATVPCEQLSDDYMRQHLDRNHERDLFGIELAHWSKLDWQHLFDRTIGCVRSGALTPQQDGSLTFNQYLYGAPDIDGEYAADQRVREEKRLADSRRDNDLLIEQALASLPPPNTQRSVDCKDATLIQQATSLIGQQQRVLKVYNARENPILAALRQRTSGTMHVDNPVLQRTMIDTQPQCVISVMTSTGSSQYAIRVLTVDRDEFVEVRRD